jgi:glycosyltransferase involved in cell wall biosynthesis
MKNGSVSLPFINLRSKHFAEALYAPLLAQSVIALMKKVLFLSNIPSPYLTPLFNRLAQKPGWKLDICYVSSCGENVGWPEAPIQHYGVNEKDILDRRFPALSQVSAQLSAALALLERVLRNRPEYLVIYGYTRLPQVMALGWCLLSGLPFAIAGDATYYADKATGIRKFLKKCWLGVISRYTSAIITVGNASEMFWEAYGARSEKIFNAPFAVDNDFFAAESQKKQDAAAIFRQRKGWEGKPIFLYVGRLIKRKNVDLLIRAIQQLDEQNVAAVIVGSGEERAALEKLAAGDPRIHFAGGASQAELPFYYALADVLVLPASAEPWGLVVNEAMACGLAVITHWQCGAALDLVTADNGVLLRSFAVDELAAALKSIAADEPKLRQMQQRSGEQIAGWSFDNAALAIHQAVEVTSKRAALPVKATAAQRDWEKPR